MTAVIESLTDTWTLVGTVRRRAMASPDVVAMRAKRLGIWRGITWAAAPAPPPPPPPRSPR